MNKERCVRVLSRSASAFLRIRADQVDIVACRLVFPENIATEYFRRVTEAMTEDKMVLNYL